MESIAYHQLVNAEKVGFYYRLRIAIVKKLIQKFILPVKTPLNILDVGCGTGGSTIELCEFGNVKGMEPSIEANRLLKANYPSLAIKQGGIAQANRLFSNEYFDLITILGVLYHQQVPSPLAALQQISTLQKPGSWLIWNEAAYRQLRRRHDAIVHGTRRFHPDEMVALLKNSGYHLVFASHLLSWAYPVAWLLARIPMESRAVTNSEALDHKMQTSVMNRFLYILSYIDWWINYHICKLPFGVSYLIVAKRTRQSSF